MSKILRCAILLAAVGLVAAAPPARLDPARLAGFTDLYAPQARGKDYELYLASYKGEEIRGDIVQRRRGDWVKIEAREGKGLNVQYVHVPTGVVIERAGDFLNIRSPESAPTPGIDYASKKTGRSWTAAGQKCRIWEVYRGVDAGYTIFTRFGCLTSDGIEVARWTTGRAGGDVGEKTTGYHLVRRKLQDADVRPSAATFDLSPWLVGAPKTSAADFEVVLKAAQGAERMTVRRQGDWTFKETVNADGSRDLFTDGDGGVSISARIGARGEPLSFTARKQPPIDLPPDVRSPEPGREILGLKCEWYAPAVAADDAGYAECRTADGVILAVSRSAREGDVTYVADSISRRPLATADLLPPAWLLDPTRWGAGG